MNLSQEGNHVVDPIQAIVLGVVQGLTEFLPISSSGHLIIFQHILGLREAEILFDISVHVGTLVAVIVFLREELLAMLRALNRGIHQIRHQQLVWRSAWQDRDIRLAALIVIGSFPTAILGLCFKQISETLFSTVLIVGIDLIITGVLLWFTRRFHRSGRSIDGLSIRDALIIGTVQGFAIMPGISRSGSTISAGIFLGINHELAARFSFLLSIPAVLGATLLSLKDFMDVGGMVWQTWFAGAIASGIVGYLSLKVLLLIVKKGNLFSFAPYCWLTGLIAIAWGLSAG
ncbi:MAG: undecaprenyl-diphosphatase UppP [Desulfatirhabdiaceae bacterium]